MKRTNVGSYLKIKNICNAEVIDLEKLAQKKKKGIERLDMEQTFTVSSKTSKK